MSGKTGAAWCLERGLHYHRKTAPGLTQCVECGDVQSIPFTADELDQFAARDALIELRAEQEAADVCSDGERDLRAHEVER